MFYTIVGIHANASSKLNFQIVQKIFYLPCATINTCIPELYWHHDFFLQATLPYCANKCTDIIKKCTLHFYNIRVPSKYLIKSILYLEWGK